jgi:hypothetical protein
MASQSQVDSELAKLKQEVGSGDEQKQLAGGGSAAEEPATAEETKPT